MATGIDRAWAGYEQTNTFTFTAAQIRTLNSLPVEMVAVSGVNMLALPISAIVAFKPSDPPVAFSDSVQPIYLINTGQATSPFTMDGTASMVVWDDDFRVFKSFSGADLTVNNQDIIGYPIRLTSVGDVTGGDGVLTIVLTYRVIDLTGLI